MARSVFVILVFVTVSTDVFLQLAPEAADWALFLRLPVLVGILFFAVITGATAAHILLSMLQGTNVLDDIIQEEPVKQLVK